MATEYCVCCGNEIPEGSLVCPNCADSRFTSKPVTHILGIPMEEAAKVLSLYKCGVPCPNKDYLKGFEDGYNRAMNDQTEAMNECLNRLRKTWNAQP